MDNLKKASAWLSLFEDATSDAISYLKTIYGNDDRLIERKTEKYVAVLKKYIEKHGDNPVTIVRAPGRINLMGRHVEHRGGNINAISIHKETIMIASLRNDDKICISNVDKRFGDFEFSISEEKALCHCNDWLSYIESDRVKDCVARNRGHWVNYVKAAILRLALQTKEYIKGMNIVCLGTIPIAGGVSSSSSIVVATAELVCKLNNFEFELSEFINLCGQAEWYVGSRGGSGDHAAIKCGVLDSISPIAFEPINFLGSIALPEGYSIIVANSFIEAKKSEGAKDKFNQMVAAYEFGVMMIKKNYPQHCEKIKHLRDINPATLGVSEKEIYEMLLSIPLFIKSEELFDLISEEYHDKVNSILKTHKAPEAYNLRSAVLFGIAECERSRMCASLLNDGKIDEFAEMMNISHNGDRVAQLIEGEVADYDYYMTDKKLISLIEKSTLGDPDAILYKQPGGYACSVEQIDILIDKTLKQPGVLSAQISGAGLGGCIMILCEKSHEKEILDFLRTEYYEPNGFVNGAIIVRPINGSMCLENI